MKLCLRELPEKASIYQVGLMVPRKTEAIRLIVTKMSPETGLEYLNRIDYPGDTKVVADLLNRYMHWFDYVVFNVHIGKSVLPLLGIEMYLRDMKQPQWEQRWQSVFNSLIQENLALNSKTEALVRFCSKTRSQFPLTYNYLNGINHLKMVFKNGQAAECKGYFGSMIRHFDYLYSGTMTQEN